MSSNIWSYSTADFQEKYDTFIALIINFRSLIQKYNSGEFKDKEKDFYNELNKLKKEIISTELFNPKTIKEINYFNNPKNKGDFSYNLLEVLRNFPKIDNKLLDSPEFYNEIHSIFEHIVLALAFDTYNIGDFSELIAKVFNKITREKYFVVICDHLKGDDEFKIYNCGRAFMQNYNKSLPETRFIIFNTNMDAQPDRFILEKYGEKIESDFLFSSVNLNNSNDSASRRREFMTEVLQYKSEPRIDKQIVLENFFNKVFDKMFYINPKKLGIKIYFNIVIPILDFNYDIIFEIILEKGDKKSKYKFYTVLNPKESPFGPHVLTEVQYLSTGEEKRRYANQGLLPILINREKLI